MDESALHNEPALHTASTTTLEEDKHSESRRIINLTWEYTQAAVAIMVVLANVIAAFALPETSQLLSNAFFLVIGFYFGRTNHARPDEQLLRR